jgi:CO/xanthine dehydrogenase Mo-binding subunit
MPTGQIVDSAAPVAELLRRVQAAPMPGALDASDVRNLPGGASNATHGESVRRGIGYGIGIKNVAFSEGFEDHATARVRVEQLNGELVATVQTAAAEVGQGLVTVIQQIVRTELGVEQVMLLPADTSIGSAGSTSASRQTYVTGGAVQAACEAVRQRMADGELPVDETVTWHHRPTEKLDENGQGNAHVQYAFAAHRAVVDVDIELGLVKVVELTTAQDVGKAMNPQAVVGQIQGGTAQGLGLALMEEIQIVDGIVKNPSFTDYLLPTILDMPPMNVDVLELADPHAPYGLRGVGEPPTISSTPAIVAAIRAATGVPLRRVPVRPEHLTAT